MTKYLPAINEFDEAKYDFLTNKNSKFLFHLFNKFQQDRGKPKHSIRHSVTTDDNYTLKTLQDRNWPYFIKKIIEFFQGLINLSHYDSSVDQTEINILSNTRANFEIVKNLYNELFNSVGINLHEYFKNLGIIEKQKIDTDLTNNNFFIWNPQESLIQQRILTTYRDFYYKTGRFPGRNTLIPIPRAPIPSFIDTNDVLSPRDLYESYVDRDMRGLVSLQFLAAFNRFLGGESSLSRSAMGEFLHNLPWQALTNDNDPIQIKFEARTELIKNINYLIQKEIYKNKIKTIEINQNMGGQLNNKVIETHKDVIQEIEDEVVRDIINNDDTDYKPINVPPTVKIEDEIDQNNILWNENFLKTELAKRERDIQIIDEINSKYQTDLIRKAIDPSDGQLTNE